MRARALLVVPIAVLMAAPAAHAQTPATGGTDSTAPATTDPSTAGGAAYGVDPTAAARVTVPGVKAKRLPSGLAAAPADAPVEVQEAIWAANEIVGLPYKWGGGHGRSFKDTGYDCSGTISVPLNAAGVLKAPLDSTSFMSWGEKGKGDWITVYTNPGHAFAIIAGLRLDTSSAGERRSSGKGPRWRTNLRGGQGFKIRSPKGF